jgi:putative endonuclease
MNNVVQQIPGYVYILTNDYRTVLYVSSTSNLKKRIYAHKKGLIPGFTKKYNAHLLVYFEQYPDIGQARKRERYLKKKTRTKKIALIQESNPNWNDLTPENPR